VTSPAAEFHQIRLRIDACAEAFARHGLFTDAQIAEAIGVAPSTIWRLRIGATSPSSEVIARILTFFAGAHTFDDLFHLYTGPSAFAAVAATSIGEVRL
jgi:transcriptional regulator with XRE-family HTH domain